MFDGSEKTVEDASLSIFAFMHRFSLSKVAQTQLLALFKVLLPVNNKLPKTIKELNRTVGLDNLDIQTESFCSTCSGSLNSELRCTNESCSHNDKAEQHCDSFSSIDFSPQLKTLVQHRFGDIKKYMDSKRYYN